MTDRQNYYCKSCNQITWIIRFPAGTETEVTRRLHTTIIIRSLIRQSTLLYKIQPGYEEILSDTTKLIPSMFGIKLNIAVPYKLREERYSLI